MIKKQKNLNRGFTLVEMVLVIAIILILAAVLTISITGYIAKAHKVASVVSASATAFSNSNKIIDQSFISLGF